MALIYSSKAVLKGQGEPQKSPQPQSDFTVCASFVWEEPCLNIAAWLATVDRPQ